MFSKHWQKIFIEENQKLNVSWMLFSAGTLWHKSFFSPRITWKLKSHLSEIQVIFVYGRYSMCDATWMRKVSSEFMLLFPSVHTHHCCHFPVSASLENSSAGEQQQLATFSGNLVGNIHEVWQINSSKTAREAQILINTVKHSAKKSICVCRVFQGTCSC